MNIQPHLSITTLALPSDVKSFNTGSSTEKWAKKRARFFKSAKNTPEPISQALYNQDEDNFDVSTLIDELENDASIDGNVDHSVGYEIDEDVQRLINEAARVDVLKQPVGTSRRVSFDAAGPDEQKASKRKSKRRRRKSSKEKDKGEDDEKKKKKTKVTKTVSFSLSKPPTPQTEQVIRVDVVSNYSIELEDDASNNKDAAEFENMSDEAILQRNVKYDDCTFYVSNNIKEDTKEFVVESRKAVLFNRKI